MNNKKLTEEDYIAAATALGVDEATIRAIIEVETGGKSGFLPSGKPRILFERHLMWRRLRAYGFNPPDYAEGNIDILGPDWDRQYYVGGEGEWERMERASRIHLPSAIEATSWGLFQILGMHWKALGYESAQDFSRKMEESEMKQLEAFIRYVRVNNLIDELRNKDWRGFSKKYNGPGFSENHYDTKLAAAYKKWGGK